MRPTRILMWLALGALVVLGGRGIAYAVSPSPLAAAFGGQAGGPALPVVALVSLGLALVISAAVVWLAALGIRERWLLEQRAVVEEPRLRLAVVLVRATTLAAASMLTFALLESYVHWRAGLGWHGLHCLTGPVHRDAIPVLGALSLVAAALVSALDHVLAWMRRTLASLAPRPRLIHRGCSIAAPAVAALIALTLAGAGGARAPPAFA
jgi:hypothetical protein